MSRRLLGVLALVISTTAFLGGCQDRPVPPPPPPSPVTDAGALETVMTTGYRAPTTNAMAVKQARMLPPPAMPAPPYWQPIPDLRSCWPA